MNNKTISLRKNLLWNTVGNFIYLFSQWLLTIVILHVTSYKVVGVYTLAVSVTNVLYSIALYGVRNYQVSDIKEKYSDKEYIINRYITCIFSFFICIVFLLFNSYDKEQKMAIVFYMIFHIEEAYLDVIQGIEQKNYRMDLVGISCLARGILNFFVFFFVLSYTKNLLYGIFSMIVTTAIVILMYDEKNVRTLVKQKCNYNIKNVMSLLREGIPLVIYTVLIATTPVIPRYVLEAMMGQEMLGIYATIATPAVAVQAIIGYLLAPLIGPISEKCIQKDKNGFCSLMGYLIVFISIISVLCILGAKFLGTFVLKILFGESIVQYANLLIPVLLCTVEVAIALFINALLVIFRNHLYILIVNISGMIISCFISIPMISHFKLNGTNYAQLVSMGIQIIIGILFVVKTYKKFFNMEENKNV